MPVIGIFPAAGALGSATYGPLVHTTGFDPRSVVLVSRNPDKLGREREAGATCRRADFEDKSSLKGAFEGIDILNLISYPSFQHEYRFEVAKAAIDAAISQGVKHIVYSSLAFARYGTPIHKPHVMLAHLDTEAYLATLSFPLYTANFDLKKAQDSAEREFNIRIPHDGSGPGLAWAKREELGEATANLLVKYANDPPNFSFINKIAIFSGPRALSLNETARVFSHALDKKVKIQEVSIDEYCEQEGVGYGSDSVELNRLWATAFEGIRAGEAATVTDHLREFLGRDPEDFETIIKKILEGQ